MILWTHGLWPEGSTAGLAHPDFGSISALSWSSSVQEQSGRGGPVSRKEQTNSFGFMREYSTPRFASISPAGLPGAADLAQSRVAWDRRASEAATEHLTAWEIPGNGGGPGTLALTFASLTRSNGTGLRGEMSRLLASFAWRSTLRNKRRSNLQLPAVRILGERE